MHRFCPSFSRALSRRLAASTVTGALVLAGLAAVAPARADNPAPLESVASFIESDGTPDADFSANAGTGFNRDVYSVALQADGKIVAGGFFTDLNGFAVNAVARLNADGTPDIPFNTKVGTSFSGAYEPGAFAVAVQSDGKILVAGNFTTPAHEIARLNSDGSLDTTFAANVRGGFTGSDAGSIALQADGKILVGGYFDHLDGQSVQPLVRFNADGTLDTTFLPVGDHSLDSGVLGVTVETDGHILVGTTGLVRLLSSGLPDTAFNGALTGLHSDVYSSVESQGSIAVGGFFGNGLARLSTSGTLDPSFTGFGTGFQVVYPTQGVYTLAVQPDGKTVVGGSFGTLNLRAVSRLARLASDGTPDTAFDTAASKVFDAFDDFGEFVNSVVVQPDGDIVIAGVFNPVPGGTSGGIARLTNAAPRLTTVDPSSGTDDGGTLVTITGSRLTGASAVTFGGTAVSSFTVDSATQITATTPAHAAGTVDVIVTSAGGSKTLTGAFTFASSVPSPTPTATDATPTPTATDATPTPTPTPTATDATPTATDATPTPTPTPTADSAQQPAQDSAQPAAQDSAQPAAQESAQTPEQVADEKAANDEPVAASAGMPTPPNAGTGELLVSDIDTSMTLTSNDAESSIVIAGGRMTLAMHSATNDGKRLPLATDGNLVLSQQGDTTFLGTGFKASSWVSVYVFSDPTFLGNLQANADGNFVGSLQLPASIGAGHHTVQLDGVTAAGQNVAMNLSVTVVSPTSAAAYTSSYLGRGFSPLAGSTWRTHTRVPITVIVRDAANGGRRVTDEVGRELTVACAVSAVVTGVQSTKPIAARVCLRYDAKVHNFTGSWQARSVGQLRMSVSLASTGRVIAIQHRLQITR